MVREGIKGKVVFCSSILGYFSMVGYSTYSPGKFAIRGGLRPYSAVDIGKIDIQSTGLAETLQSEYMLYGITVHIAFPGTMYTKAIRKKIGSSPKSRSK